MKNLIRGVKRITAAILVTTMLVTGNSAVIFDLSVSSMSKVEAAADSAITYEYYTVTLKNTVPASWLFVGTYLMSAKGVTSQVYQLALKSRETYNQYIAFYTSELDGSQWKNIKDATNINNITAAAGSVSENDLFPYLITCVVGDDGIPRNPETGEVMDVFSTPDPYEMENIPELDGVEEYYENLSETDASDKSDSYRRQMLYWFFEYDNLDTYDRENLDVSAAYSQYLELSENPEELENVWDEAMKLSPSNFPSEYKELMMVMRNFPNVRDKVTDKADTELDNLNALFLILEEEKKTEEADALLYVSAQVDATRRAEIYYNLTQNDNLTGSLISDHSELIEELTLRREELNAEMMQMAAESDRAEAPIKKLRQEINDLEDENESLQTQIEDENNAYSEAGYEEKLVTLNQEMATLEDEFSSIEEEYNRLNIALDEIYDESVELDDEQTELNSEIKELRQQKKTRKAEVEEELANLASDIADKQDRYAKAELRRDEYYEGVAQLEIWESNIAKLEAGIQAETTHYDALKAEADNYTSSRVTSLVNAGKIYDPETKTDLDHQVAASKKIIDIYTTQLESITAAKEELEPVINQLQEDLALGDTLEGLQQSYNDLEKNLNEKLASDYAEIDASVKEKQDELAALSTPFQEKLKELQEANTAYNDYLPTYQAKVQEISAKHEEIVACENAISEHESLVASLTEQITVNKANINAKDAMIYPLMPTWDCLEGQIAAMQDEVDELDALIIKASTATYEDEIRREAYGNTRNSIEKRLELINTALEEAKQSQLQIIKANAELLAEKKVYEAEALTFISDYNAEVETILAEEDAWDAKWQDAYANAEYELYTFMNSAEPDGIKKQIAEEEYYIAKYEGVISKMSPFLQNEETLRTQSELLTKSQELTAAISSDVDLLLTLDDEDAAADEVRDRINSNKEELAEINQRIALVDGYSVDSNQLQAREALDATEIELTGISDIEGVDDTAKKELSEGLALIEEKRNQLDETKSVYNDTIGDSGKSYEEQLIEIQKTISELNREAREELHQYDWLSSWVKSVLKNLFGVDLDKRAKESAAKVEKKKQKAQDSLDRANTFPTLCAEYGYTDYVSGSDFNTYAEKKYAEYLAEEDALYASAQNGTPIQNYINNVTALLNERQANRSELQAELSEWEAAHAEEVAELKQAVEDAKAQIDNEKEIREERLSLAKDAYQTKVNDNKEKINKINETVSANNDILSDFKENIITEFGDRADKLLAMIPGLSSYVEDVENRRTLAELKEYLEERLNGVSVDVSAMEEQKSENEHLENVLNKQEERLTTILNEWKEKRAELVSSLSTANASLRDAWQKKQEERIKQESVLAALKESKVALEKEQSIANASEKVDHTKDFEHLDEAVSAYEELSNYQSAYDNIISQISTLQSEIDGLNNQLSALERRGQSNEIIVQISEVKQQIEYREDDISSLQKSSDYTNYISAQNTFYTILERYGFSDYDRTSGDFASYASQKEALWKSEEDASNDATTENSEQLNALIESIRQNEEKLEALKAQEALAKQEYKDAEEESNTKQEIMNNGYQIRVDSQQTVIENVKAALLEGQNKLQELKDAIDEYYGEPVADLAIQYAEADALYHSLDYVDTKYITSFGPAPTLAMLKDAASSGSPSMGRIFENMKDYGSSSNSRYQSDEELDDIIQSAFEECEASYESYTKQAMTRGESAADYTGFLLSRKVALNATDEEAAMPYLQMIVDLTNIEGGSIIHSAREISLLEGYLIPFSMSDFTTEMTEEKMDDYHYYIRALTERDTIENSIIFVENRLEYAYSLETTFANNNQSELIQTHITWLENLLRALKEQANGTSDEEDTDDEEAELIKDRDEALEEGDLKRAKKIDDLLSKIANGGGSGDDSQAGKENNPDDLLPTDVNPTTRPTAVTEIQELILDEIDNPEYDITPDLTKFINIGGPIEELEKELDKVANPSNKDAILNPSNTGGDSGSGSTSSGESADLSATDITDAIEDVLGHGTDDADDEEIAEVIEALSEIEDENPDDDITDAINDLLSQLDGSSYVYEQYRADKSTEYVSMAAVDNCRSTSGFRFVKETDSNITTMTQIFGGSASYTFTNGSKEVIKNNNTKDTLSIAAVKQTDKYVRNGDDTEYTYLSKEDAKKFLYVSGRNIKGTDKAILITSGMDATVQKIVEALEEKMLLSDE